MNFPLTETENYVTSSTSAGLSSATRITIIMSGLNYAGLLHYAKKGIDLAYQRQLRENFTTSEIDAINKRGEITFVASDMLPGGARNSVNYNKMSPEELAEELKKLTAILEQKRSIS